MDFFFSAKPAPYEQDTLKDLYFREMNCDVQIEFTGKIRYGEWVARWICPKCGKEYKETRIAKNHYRCFDCGVIVDCFTLFPIKIGVCQFTEDDMLLMIYHEIVHECGISHGKEAIKFGYCSRKKDLFSEDFAILEFNDARKWSFE